MCPHEGAEPAAQDERVMQLFELFNNFLTKDLATSHRHLDIKARRPVGNAAAHGCRRTMWCR